MLLTNDINISPYIRPGIVLPATPNINNIINAVCEYFNITRSELFYKNRKTRVVFARQIAMYYMRKELRCGLREIGETFGKDHTTVIHSCKQISNFLSIQDLQTLTALREIKSIIRNSNN